MPYPIPTPPIMPMPGSQLKAIDQRLFDHAGDIQGTYPEWGQRSRWKALKKPVKKPKKKKDKKKK